MTPNQAEGIVHQYASVLEAGKAGEGPASYATKLGHSPQIIIQAMKLCLATDIKKGSLTENMRNLMGSAANRLPYFVNDEEARRLNAIQTDYLSKRHRVPSEVDYRSLGEMHEWALYAAEAGMALRCQLVDFIAAVERFDPNDPLYWERVHDLAKT